MVHGCRSNNYVLCGAEVRNDVVQDRLPALPHQVLFIRLLDGLGEDYSGAIYGLQLEGETVAVAGAGQRETG